MAAATHYREIALLPRPKARPPKVDERNLRLATYLTPDLPKPPPKVEVYKAVKSWPMMLNDRYGDCTCAAAGHIIQDWTAACRHEQIPADGAILDAYYRVSQGLDEGAAMLDVLKLWRKGGIARHLIHASAQLDADSKAQLRHSIHFFGAAYIGLALPDFAVDCTDTLKVSLAITPPKAAQPRQQNGHCVCAVGYGSTSIYVVTWGALKAMSWAFYRAYNDEAYAVLSRDWIDAKLGMSPLGFNFSTLHDDPSRVARG